MISWLRCTSVHFGFYKTGIPVASNLNRAVTLNRKTQHFLIQISFVWLISSNKNNNMRTLILFYVLCVVFATFCDAAPPNRSSTLEEPLEEESLEKMTPHEQKVHIYRKMRERLVQFTQLKFPDHFYHIKRMITITSISPSVVSCICNIQFLIILSSW